MKTTVLLHADEIARVLDRLACQIMERHGDCEQTVLLGIQRRGVDLAVRLGKVLEDKLGRKLPFGTLDINLYRDDWTTMHARPTIGEVALSDEEGQFGGAQAFRQRLRQGHEGSKLARRGGYR